MGFRRGDKLGLEGTFQPTHRRQPQRASKVRLIEARKPDWRDLYPELTEGIRL